MAGTLAGRYRVEDSLGTGGMGQVYRAYDLKLRRIVAIKRMSSELAGSEPYRRRLLTEARSAARVNHQGLAALYDVIEQDDRLFLVMEYVEGVTLRERLSSDLDIDTALQIMLECAEALRAAHQAGIVHHDIKPANIMIGSGGCVKILDFGLAQVAAAADPDGSTVSHWNETSSVAGTPAYMAPEVLLGQPADHRADLFSLGVVFYELLTRTNPFVDQTPSGISDRILHLEVPPVLAANPGAPPQLEAIVSKLLAKSAKLRYATTDDLVVDLRTVQLQRSGAGSARGDESSRVARPRRPATLLATAALVLAAVAAAPWAYRAWQDLRAGLASRTDARAHAPDSAAADVEPASQMFVAVLPLSGLVTASSEGQAVADGLAATLTTRLTQLTREHRFQVASNDSLLARRVVSVADARREIGVNRVLTFHLQQQAERIRVNVSLVDAASGVQIAAALVDGLSADLIDLQEQVSNRVLRMLRLELRPMEGGLFQAGTSDPQAYAYYISGEGYRRKANDEQGDRLAIEQFEQALRVDPEFARAHAALGRTYISLYENSDQPQWVARAKGECDRAVTLDELSASSHACVGSVLVATGAYQEAIASLRRARDLDPTDERVVRQLGRALEHLGRDADAEATYREAIRSRPHVAAPYTWLGGFLVRRRNLGPAVAAYEQAIRLAPDSYRTHSNLGVVHFFAEDWTGAKLAFQRALQIKPDYEFALSNLGTVLFFEGDYEGAADAFQRAIDISPQRYFTWGNLGDARQYGPGDRARAADAYREATRLAEQRLQVNPNDAIIRSRIAYYRAMLGEYPTAREHARRALELEPESSDVRFKLALTFVRLGNLDEALEHLAHAIELGYSRAEIRANPMFDGLRGNAEYQALVGA